jgi:hypothetical protein
MLKEQKPSAGLDIEKFNPTTDLQFNNSQKVNISEVFADRKGSYLNEFTLFLCHFNKIPNFTHEINIDCEKASHWFWNTYRNDIKDLHYTKRFLNKTDKVAKFDDVFYILYDDLIVDFDTNQSIVRFLFRKTDIVKIEKIISKVQDFRKRQIKGLPKISLLVNTARGIETKSLKVTKPRLDLEYNYNDDFKEVHQVILKRLRKKNDKGLVLLHGKPGTGKTSYIRFLISLLKKDVIFLPPNMAGSITNPDLISILIDNPNSVFVIEDAENIVFDREKDGHSPVSALLNISDGLLADCLNIQIICSFNTDLSKVDSALMRKGRLIAKYEFKELDLLKTNRLSEKLGYSAKCLAPMTLTSIYNQSEKNYSPSIKSNTIGFKSSNIN